MCDPGMCDNCVYIGEGDFICDKGAGEPVIVVEDWHKLLNISACPAVRQLGRVRGRVKLINLVPVQGAPPPAS